MELENPASLNVHVEAASSWILVSTRRQIYFYAVGGHGLIRNQMMDEPGLKLGTALFALCLAPKPIQNAVTKRMLGQSEKQTAPKNSSKEKICDGRLCVKVYNSSQASKMNAGNEKER
jgi:hypothetical protein